MISLLDAATANGNGSAATYPGGEAVITCFGTSNGETVKLQMSPDSGTTWIDVETLTVNNVSSAKLPACQIRGTIASAGASTSVSLEVEELAFSR